MKSIVEEKSFKFAVRVVRLYKYLTEKKKEKILSKQLLRSGTSIGANIAEAEQAQSNADFVTKHSAKRNFRDEILDKANERNRVLIYRGMRVNNGRLCRNRKKFGNNNQEKEDKRVNVFNFQLSTFNL